MVGRNDKHGSGGKEVVGFWHTLSWINEGSLLLSKARKEAARPPSRHAPSAGQKEAQKAVKTKMLCDDWEKATAPLEASLSPAMASWRQARASLASQVPSPGLAFLSGTSA